MAILDDLSKYLGRATAMKVAQSVLLIRTDDGVPRARMAAKNVQHHALITGPAGVFLCDLEVTNSSEFFSALATEDVEVTYFERIAPDDVDAISLEGNWPSKKVLILEDYYAVPRNFARPLRELLTGTQGKKKRRR